MKYKATDYTFWGLISGGAPRRTPVTTLVYLVSLVDTPENEIMNLSKAYSVLSDLFEAEEQVKTGPELLTLGEDFPQNFSPQTPVMTTLSWSPIAALLERGFEPLVLSKQPNLYAVASGIWAPLAVEDSKRYEDCQTPEELFWSLLKEVAIKAKARGKLINIVAKPGWSYRDNLNRPFNLNLAEAKKGDRVIWQRTPRPGVA